MIYIKNKKKFISIIISILCIFVLVVGIYFGSYSHSEQMVDRYLVSSESVKVELIDNYYYFNGTGDRAALIFYPGAKVEAKAYAPLMYRLAEQGVDCFLVKMPLNFAFFNENAAAKIIGKYNYEDWYMSGHSLGGVVAASYLSKNEDKSLGLILIASYPTKNISESTRFLSIYGSEDGVLNKEKYNKSKKYWNKESKEVEIKGGNHAQYGNYGAQKKDNEATITTEVQQEDTVRSIIEFINEKKY